MHYLVRLVQVHETFRVPELESLAMIASVDMEIIHYDKTSPFCIISLENEQAARAIIHRAILSHAIYEFWAAGEDYPSIHANLQSTTAIDASQWSTASFRFDVDCFQGKRSAAAQLKLIESFKFLPFRGSIQMRDPEMSMCIFEEYETIGAPVPRKIYLGRWIAGSGRHSTDVYSLKKRRYISRTSMDAELSLVTANLTLAAPGKLIYDPFVGTGSFTVSCAHFGAVVLGSDIDARSIRGTKQANLYSNFEQYGTTGYFLESFIADLTHTPLRAGQILDGIICDPPYGVREGPKVLGDRRREIKEPVLVDGVPAHLRPGYLPPRRPYSFDDMMADVLDFAFLMLLDNARLTVWMPTANDEDIELAIPLHPGLELKAVCVQQFNKWARRLLVYRRRLASELSGEYTAQPREYVRGATADDMNRFRKKYFAGFKPEGSPADPGE